MDGLRSWIITLVTIVVLCTIVEKFALQGNLNKYIQLVCGLAVTLVISMPLLSFFNRGLKIEAFAWNDYIKISEAELYGRIEKLQQEDSRQILEIYRQSLISDIKSRFMGEGEFMVTDVDAVLYENSKEDTFGMIRALYLKLKPGAENRPGVISSETVARIKDELAQVFSVDKENIIIDLSSFNGGE